MPFHGTSERVLDDAFRGVWDGDEVSLAYRDNAVVMELISFITADATRPIAKVAIEADD